MVHLVSENNKMRNTRAVPLWQFRNQNTLVFSPENFSFQLENAIDKKMFNQEVFIKLYHFNQLKPKFWDLQLTKIKKKNYLLSLELEKFLHIGNSFSPFALFSILLN